MCPDLIWQSQGIPLDCSIIIFLDRNVDTAGDLEGVIEILTFCDSDVALVTRTHFTIP